MIFWEHLIWISLGGKPNKKNKILYNIHWYLNSFIQRCMFKLFFCPDHSRHLKLVQIIRKAKAMYSDKFTFQSNCVTSFIPFHCSVNTLVLNLTKIFHTSECLLNFFKILVKVWDFLQVPSPHFISLPVSFEFTCSFFNISENALKLSKGHLNVKHSLLTLLHFTHNIFI